MLQLLVPPLLSLTHADGSLGSWQGAGAVSADRVAALIAASGVRTRPLRDARQWGYQRVTGGKAVLQMDAGPPPLMNEMTSPLYGADGHLDKPFEFEALDELVTRVLAKRAH
jgi:uncharacterized heparinase superfamily protein